MWPSGFSAGGNCAEQLDAMAALLAGRDVLAVMPTGSGKSAIYQVPGVLLDGATLVISPLIALQQDQIAHLANFDVPDAEPATPISREINALRPRSSAL
jgi:superfamily II DNA helicase RecQ